MAPSTIQKAIGAMKDQTTIGIAKVASNIAPELKVAIVKATSHDDDPASEKYIRKILYLTSNSRGYVNACVYAISKRLGKTRDWMVALKCLMLVHRLLIEGNSVFHQEFIYATRRGTRLLNLSDFRDEAHSSSWDHSAFVRSLALYLDQRLEMMVYEKKQRGSVNAISPPGSNRRSEYEYESEFRDEPYGMMRRSRSSGDVKESKDELKDVTPLREMKPERIFGKMGHLQRLMDKFLLCRPRGLAKNEKMVLVALYPLIKESFKLYGDICEVLSILIDKFFDMEHQDCVKAFDAYAVASKQVDELVGFYSWCKDIGVARSSDYPEVQKITSKMLDTLEEFVRDKAKAKKSPEKKVESQPVEEKEVVETDMNEIKALPPPEDYSPPPPPEAEPEPPKQDLAPLVDLRDDDGVTSADDQGNRLALALFAGPVGNGTNGSWEAFASNGQDEVTSAWQNPAAEIGKADWELALVESASHLSKQKATLGGGLNPLLLNGMYDQGIITQHTSTAQLTGGSASSVALPGPGKTPVLALPAPDGSVQAVGNDPFAASLSIPPPSYVQMSDMEKKQQFVVQEQMVWNQYARDGMQGQTSLAKISTGGYYAAGYPPVYGMPAVNAMGMPNGAGYYYT